MLNSKLLVMIKERRNYTVEIYAPYCGAWIKVATLPFAPSMRVVEAIVADYVREYPTPIDRWRVRHGHAVIGSYVYGRGSGS